MRWRAFALVVLIAGVGSPAAAEEEHERLKMTFQAGQAVSLGITVPGHTLLVQTGAIAYKPEGSMICGEEMKGERLPMQVVLVVRNTEANQGLKSTTSGVVVVCQRLPLEPGRRYTSTGSNFHIVEDQISYQNFNMVTAPSPP